MLTSAIHQVLLLSEENGVDGAGTSRDAAHCDGASVGGGTWKWDKWLEVHVTLQRAGPPHPPCPPSSPLPRTPLSPIQSLEAHQLASETPVPLNPIPAAEPERPPSHTSGWMRGLKMRGATVEFFPVPNDFAKLQRFLTRLDLTARSCYNQPTGSQETREATSSTASTASPSCLDPSPRTRRTDPPHTSADVENSVAQTTETHTATATGLDIITQLLSLDTRALAPAGGGVAEDGGRKGHSSLGVLGGYARRGEVGGVGGRTGTGGG